MATMLGQNPAEICSADLILGQRTKSRGAESTVRSGPIRSGDRTNRQQPRFANNWRYRVQINVSARHGSISGPDNQLVQEKADKLLRFHERINAIAVTVDFQNNGKPKVEIIVTAEHAPEFVASAEATTVIAAMDLALGKMEQQLRKHKEKLTDHKAASVKHISTNDEQRGS